MSCGAMKKSGADLRKVIMTAKGMTSSEGLRGIEYQLLNALAVRNVNKFMDVVMRLYSAYAVSYTHLEVKKSRKLLCSQVKIGSQVRQIVSGIKAHYSAEEMVGKKVMVVTNLKPAKLAGILSEGMILCAEDADGNLSLMVPEKEMPAGAEIC